MADADDRVCRVNGQCLAERIRGPRHQVLEGLAAGESHQVGRRFPQAVEHRVGRGGLFVGAPLPGAVVEVVQAVEHGDPGAAAGAGDRLGGRQAALHRAGVDGHGRPVRGDEGRGAPGLAKAHVGERQLHPAAEAFRRYAVDMAVAGQDQLGHIRPLIAGPTDAI